MTEQRRLRDVFFSCAKKGAYVMLSNSDTQQTRELYKNANIHQVFTNRAINSDPKKRGKIAELLITNF